jgi:hypothetical protein
LLQSEQPISGIVIDTDQFKQTKTLQEDELHIYDAYRADLQTQEEFTLDRFSDASFFLFTSSNVSQR